MKGKKLVGINNFCEHSHNISKGKYVYATKMYKDMAKSLCGEFSGRELIIEKTFGRTTDF